jgi:dsRNA-specific ribonuclease
LEFLGDAIIDIIVVTELFIQQPDADQGALALQKSEATCNKRFCEIACKLRLHRLINTRDTFLKKEFVAYEKRLIARASASTIQTTGSSSNPAGIGSPTAASTTAEIGTLMPAVLAVAVAVAVPDANNTVEPNGIEVHDMWKPKRIFDADAPTDPRSAKCLADVVEAIVGAVYIDSEGNMQEVDRLLRRLDILPRL